MAMLQRCQYPMICGRLQRGQRQRSPKAAGLFAQISFQKWHLEIYSNFTSRNYYFKFLYVKFCNINVFLLFPYININFASAFYIMNCFYNVISNFQTVENNFIQIFQFHIFLQSYCNSKNFIKFLPFRNLIYNSKYFHLAQLIVYSF